MSFWYFSLASRYLCWCSGNPVQILHLAASSGACDTSAIWTLYSRQVSQSSAEGWENTMVWSGKTLCKICRMQHSSRIWTCSSFACPSCTSQSRNAVYEEHSSASNGCWMAYIRVVRFNMLGYILSHSLIALVLPILDAVGDMTVSRFPNRFFSWVFKHEPLIQYFHPRSTLFVQLGLLKRPSYPSWDN